MKRKYGGICFVLPAFTGVLIFYLIPFVDVIRRSFFSSVGNQFCGLKNYRNVLENEAFRLAAGNTFRFLAVCLPLLLILSLMVALLLQQMSQRSENGQSNLIKKVYLIPLAIPTASVVLIWKLVFDKHGMLNGMLAVWLGEEHLLAQTDWMNSASAFGVLVFSYIWKNIGYDVVLWLAGLSAIPTAVYEAATVDGAGKWQRFWLVTLPCMKPTIFMISVVSLLNAFKVFREAWLVAGNYPQEDIYLLQHLFNNWFLNLSLDKMTAGAVLLAIVILILVLLLQKCWEREV